MFYHILPQWIRHKKLFRTISLDISPRSVAENIRWRQSKKAKKKTETFRQTREQRGRASEWERKKVRSESWYRKIIATNNEIKRCDEKKNSALFFFFGRKRGAIILMIVCDNFPKEKLNWAEKRAWIRYVRKFAWENLNFYRIHRDLLAVRVRR